MTDPQLDLQPEAFPASPPAAAAEFAEPARVRRLARLQFGLCLAVTGGVLLYLLWTPGGSRAASNVAPAPNPLDSPVQLTAAGHVRIRADSPLRQKLEVVTVTPQPITTPVLTVTGTVAASLRAGQGTGRRWQFSSPELLTTYTDWQKAVADIGFARAQLQAVAQLAENRVRAQDAIVRRLAQLVAAGTDTEKDLAAGQTELLQARIQGRKEVHEAETALRVAQRAEAAASRQLEQAGVAPDLLRVTAAAVDVVVADVPETLVARVRLGQRCEATFVGVAAQRFTANVRAIAPVLSRERRSLRVLFTIDDPDDRLRPGMFADIGLGTDTRAALLAPLAGVVHVGRADYLLVRDRGGDWRIVTVQVGEVHGRTVEILEGLRAGDEVLGQGAILLKPLIVEATQRPGAPPPSGA